jgi:hypothetical protein
MGTFHQSTIVGIGGNSFGTDFFGARCDEGEVLKKDDECRS